MLFNKNGERKITFLADEGYQAIIMELIGKPEIKGHDFNILMKGLLLDAHTKGNGKPVIFNRKFNMVILDPEYRN